MEFISYFIDIILHLDVHLTQLAAQYGSWIYLILFVIIFSETGFVVTPFLPGDSLLFVAGALCAVSGGEHMNIFWLNIILISAALAGNLSNYHIGRYLGVRVYQWQDSRFFNKNALLKTQQFYEKYGGITIVLSRFLPFFRTFAPFVAGIGKMNYWQFQLYNIIGGVFWVVSLSVAGYFLGNIAWVKKNLTLIILAMLFIPAFPALLAVWRNYRASRQ